MYVRRYTCSVKVYVCNIYMLCCIFIIQYQHATHQTTSWDINIYRLCVI